jgi:hypothetical protein
MKPMMSKTNDKTVKIKLDDFYTMGTSAFALGFVFNMLLLFLILLFTAFFPYASIYLPKLFNFPFESTVITLGLYTTACIWNDERFLIAVALSSLIAFLTTCLYLNELTNSAGDVSVTTRFTGTFDYAMLNPSKSMQISNDNREPMDADIYIYSGLIFTVSYAIFINFLHFVFAMVYLFRQKYNSQNNAEPLNSIEKSSTSRASDFGWNRKKPGDYARVVGSVLAFVIILIGCAQSIAALWCIGVMPITLFVSFIALSPPVIKVEKLSTTQEVESLVKSGNSTETEERRFETNNPLLFAIYLVFLVLGCFYTIANYTIDASWRVYNDVSIFCETNTTKLFNKGFEYLIQNESYAGETVTYTAISGTVTQATKNMFCFDGISSFMIVVLMLMVTLSHFAMLKYLCVKD